MKEAVVDRRAWFPFFLLALVFASADATPFSRQDELNYADNTHSYDVSYHDQFGLYLQQPGGDCGHWAERTLGAGCPGLWYTLKNMGRMNPNCLARNYHKRYKDGLPRLEYLLPYLHDYLGFDTSRKDVDHNGPPSDLTLIGLFPNLEPGDVFIIQPQDPSVNVPGHAVIIRTVGGSAIGYQDHSGYHEGDLADMVDRFWHSHGGTINWTMRVIHPPEKVAGCRENRWRFGVDSSWTSHVGFGIGSDGGYTTHNQICCWHENLGGTWPWYSDSTGYACLSLSVQGTHYLTLGHSGGFNVQVQQERQRPLTVSCSRGTFWAGC